MIDIIFGVQTLEHFHHGIDILVHDACSDHHSRTHRTDDDKLHQDEGLDEKVDACQKEQSEYQVDPGDDIGIHRFEKRNAEYHYQIQAGKYHDFNQAVPDKKVMGGSHYHHACDFNVHFILYKKHRNEKQTETVAAVFNRYK